MNLGISEADSARWLVQWAGSPKSGIGLIGRWTMIAFKLGAMPYFQCRVREVPMRFWIFLLGISAGPAAADNYTAFQSPTGNIHCAIHEKAGTEVNCDMREYSPSYTLPVGCDGLTTIFSAWDFSLKGGLSCTDANLIRSDNAVLPYGEAISLGGISCVSAKTGMTCTNAAGHGFSVARARQKLF